MNVSTIPLLSQLGVTAISAVTGISPLSRPQQTLRNNKPTVVSRRASIPYVAFGDSLTTGSSIATCRDNRKQSPWGCTESPTAAIPYPDRVANYLGYKYSDNPSDYKPKNIHNNPIDLYRSGVWGYTVQEAATNKSDWLSQIDAISRATQLVTGSLGINDLHFSDVGKWVKLYIRPGQDRITPAVKAEIKNRERDFDKLFRALAQAQENGAAVVVGLYYNPYDVEDPNCSPLRTIGDRIVNTLDEELENRAHSSGFYVADFRRPFYGHGSGSEDPYVFGTQCSITDVVGDLLPWKKGGGGKKAIAIGFDPHPNNQGTLAMAQAIMREFNNAD